MRKLEGHLKHQRVFSSGSWFLNSHTNWNLRWAVTCVEPWGKRAIGGCGGATTLARLWVDHVIFNPGLPTILMGNLVFLFLFSFGLGVGGGSSLSLEHFPHFRRRGIFGIEDHVTYLALGKHGLDSSQTPTRWRIAEKTWKEKKMRGKKEKNRKEKEVEGVGNPGKWVRPSQTTLSQGIWDHNPLP